MNTYPKIKTLFNRDEKFKVVVGDYRRPEYAIIDDWIVTEKIDGTNIRLQFKRDHFEDTGNDWSVCGKTDNAQVPQPLLKTLMAWCEQHEDQIQQIMTEHGLTEYCLYGEGYGPKIQNGGYYGPDQSFILFDVKAGDAWLDHLQVQETAMELDLQSVPILGRMRTQEALMLVCSTSPLMTTFAVEPRPAEGIVAKPVVPLYDRRGERVMWKLKAKDFA